MGTLTDKIGVKMYNSYVTRRNKFVRGEYNVADKAKKTARYLYSVGNNISEDVKAGAPKNAFPFKMPKESKRQRKRRRNNPYSLI